MQKSAEQADHAFGAGAGGFADVFVRERGWVDAGGQVGDEREGRDLDAAGGGNDGLGDGRHADEVDPECAVGADFGGGLEGGACGEGVDALGKRDVGGGGGGVEGLAQGGRIDARLVGEARSVEGIVGAGEGMEGIEAEVIGDEDDVARVIGRIDATGCIREEQSRDGEASAEVGRKDGGLPLLALVPVTATAEGQASGIGLIREGEEDDAAIVSGDRGLTEARERLVGAFGEDAEAVEGAVPAGAKDEGDGGMGSANGGRKRRKGGIEKGGVDHGRRRETERGKGCVTGGILP